MKPTDQELKAMFGQTPDSFTAAMERAIAGEKPAQAAPAPRRINRTWSIVLIVALALALTTGAYAAALRLGLRDMLNRGVLSVIPQSALEALQATEAQSWEVGPLTVSLNETLADGYMTYVVSQINTTDGSKALMVQGTDDFYIEVPDNLKAYLGIEADRMFDAAASFDGPIYTVDVWLNIDSELIESEVMGLEGVYGDDGSLLVASMTPTIREKLGDTLSGELQVKVCQLKINGYQEETSTVGSETYHMDRETVEEWEAFLPIELPVTGVIETRTYWPDGDNDLGWCTVEKVDAERTAAGMYVYISLTASEDGRGWVECLDANQQEYPRNDMYSTTHIDRDDFPHIVVMTYYGTDELPDPLYVQSDDITVRLK